MAAKTYRVAGAVVVGDVLECEPGGVPEGGDNLRGQDGLIFCAALLQALYWFYALCARRGRSDPVLGAIRHPGVQVEQGAGVDAFLVREPVLIAGGGDGAVAAEA